MDCGSSKFFTPFSNFWISKFLPTLDHRSAGGDEDLRIRNAHVMVSPAVSWPIRSKVLLLSQEQHMTFRPTTWINVDFDGSPRALQLNCKSNAMKELIYTALYSSSCWMRSSVEPIATDRRSCTCRALNWPNWKWTAKGVISTFKVGSSDARYIWFDNTFTCMTSWVVSYPYDIRSSII